MAIRSYDPSETAQQLGLNDAMLVTIINESQNSATQMNSLGGNVEATAFEVNQAMQSDAGQVMRNRLQIWRDDYGTIVSSFVDLNQRAQDLLNALRNADASATEQAR